MASAPAAEKPASGVSLANWPTSEIALPGAAPGSASGGAAQPPSVPAANPPPVMKAIHIPARGVVKNEAGELEKPEQSQAFKLGVTIAVVAGALALCVAGFLGWKHFASAKSPERRPPIAAPGKATVPPKVEHPAATSTPAPAVVPPPAEPAPTPAPSTELARSEPAPAQPTAPERSTPVTPVDRRPASPASSSVSTPLVPGVNANVPVHNVGASPEFRAWVANVKISGVFQGANGRAFINGQMTRVGDPVDTRLGIIFEGIDADKKQIIFKDTSGATATRKY